MEIKDSFLLEDKKLVLFSSGNLAGEMRFIAIGGCTRFFKFSCPKSDLGSSQLTNSQV